MEGSEPARRLAVAGATGPVGSQLLSLARQAGHPVVALSRSTGVDLTESGSVGDRLEGVDTLVDVTRSPSMYRDEAVEFFTTVASNLARAAHGAGVRRLIVLSIVGIEQSQDYDWYVATLAHERTIRELGPGALVLRATGASR